MRHKHCVFCGVEIPVPRPSTFNLECDSPSNTSPPDTFGKRYHAAIIGSARAEALHSHPLPEQVDAEKWEIIKGVMVRWDEEAKVFVGLYKVYSQGTSKEEAVAAVKSAVSLLGAALSSAPKGEK